MDVGSLAFYAVFVGCWGALQELDVGLSAAAREGAALQLRLGQLLEVMGSRGVCFELGFSSISAYALERAERNTRWVEAARCLARRLEGLPVLRRAVACGELSWSKAELLARLISREAVSPEAVSPEAKEQVAPQNEAALLTLARQKTLRELRLMFGAEPTEDETSEESCTLTVTMNREESWLFEATRSLLEAMGTRTVEDQLQALLAEGQGSLLAGLPSGAIEAEELELHDPAREHWLEQLRRWRSEAEARCEERLRDGAERDGAERDGAERDSAKPDGAKCDSARRDGSACDGARPDGAECDSAGSHGAGCDGAGCHCASCNGAGRDGAGCHCAQRVSARRDSAQPDSAQRVSTERDSNRRDSAQRVSAQRDSAERDGAGRDWAGIGAVAHAAALGCAELHGKSPEELDELVRALSSAAAQRELELARLALRLHQCNGWRRLGYATEGQYARERLGMSRSSLLARRSLAAKLERLPLVAHALQSGQLGVEAALQLGRVATAATEAAWLVRARRRTVKHLREEVLAALTAVRVSGELDCPPPLLAELDAFQELERTALRGGVSQASGVDEQGQRDRCMTQPLGEASEPNGDSVAQPHGATPEPNGAKTSQAPFGPMSAPNGAPTDRERSAWPATLRSLQQWLAGGVQISAGSSAGSRRGPLGRVVYRWRVSRETRAWWRSLQAQARPWLARGVSWVRFLCLSMWRAWGHLLEVKVAYHRIYLRDRQRCSSPVCTCRDVTPHHLTFRSNGGGEEDENLTSLCTWCHLRGVHGGRIRARGPASRIRWELGSRRQPCVVVEGRERVSGSVARAHCAAAVGSYRAEPAGKASAHPGAWCQ